MHAKHVEALLARPTTPSYHFGPTPEDAETDDQILDALFERWNRNPQF
jgi:hypothetical protein